MCVGLSAKVVKIQNGTALVDATGATGSYLTSYEPDVYVFTFYGRRTYTVSHDGGRDDLLCIPGIGRDGSRERQGAGQGGRLRRGEA